MSVFLAWGKAKQSVIKKILTVDCRVYSLFPFFISYMKSTGSVEVFFNDNLM